jgi:DNA-binding transcriptional LysR family regulator
VLAPMSFGTRHLAPWLPHLLEIHPRLSIDLILDDRVEAAGETRHDLALRAGDLPDSARIVRKLAPLRSVVCAAPAYLSRNGIPGSPVDLADHNCVLFSYSDNRDVWEFRAPAGPERITVQGNLKVNSSEALASALVAGGGIGRLPTFIASAFLAEGSLVPLLRDLEMPSKPLYVEFPNRTLISRATRTLVDFLVGIYDPELPYWDR